MNSKEARDILKKHAEAYGDSRYEPALWVIEAVQEVAEKVIADIAQQILARGGYATLQANPDLNAQPQLKFVEAANAQSFSAVRIRNALVVREPVKSDVQTLALKGRIFEIGMLEDGSGRGMRLESEGEDFSIVGLSEDECRTAAKWFGETVDVRITASTGE